MKLTVPTNWQGDLVARIKRPQVDAVFGKLREDYVGGGRPSLALPGITKAKAASHIKAIRAEGMKFHYLLNASCMDNREVTRSGQDGIIRLLSWLSEINVDGIVLTIPYLLEFAKRKYPKFEFSVSCFANVNSVEKAKFWEDLGASVITLSLVEANRNFKLLEKIRKSVSCQLQLIVNETCLQDCPMYFYHNNTTSHSSQRFGVNNAFMIDYCRLSCKYKKIVNPVNFIRASWIRPEDLSVYENVGIDRFKLVDRCMNTDAIVLAVDAYSKRSYPGNLNDLFLNASKNLWVKNSGFLHKLKYFMHPFKVNIFKMFKHRGILRDTQVYIDNTKLDGFLDYFMNEDCRYKSCDECGYCQRLAEKVVRVDPEFRRQAMKQYENVLEQLNSGEIFKY